MADSKKTRAVSTTLLPGDKKETELKKYKSNKNSRTGVSQRLFGSTGDKVNTDGEYYEGGRGMTVSPKRTTKAASNLRSAGRGKKEEKKEYKAGGKVRGAGCAERGVRAAKMR